MSLGYNPADTSTGETVAERDRQPRRTEGVEGPA